MQSQANRAQVRGRAVADDEFLAVYMVARPWIRVAMMLTLVTGIAEGDLVKLKRSNFTDDGLLYTRGKTGREILVQWSMALQA